MDPSPPTLRPASWTPAIRMGLSIAVATGLYGISFGALAVAAGADYLVVGRPITAAADPLATARQIVAEMASSLTQQQN